MIVFKKAYYYFEEWLIDLFKNRIYLISLLIVIACILQIDSIDIKFINGEVFSKYDLITNVSVSRIVFYIALSEAIGLTYFLGKFYKKIRKNT